MINTTKINIEEEIKQSTSDTKYGKVRSNLKSILQLLSSFSWLTWGDSIDKYPYFIMFIQIVLLK